MLTISVSSHFVFIDRKAKMF